LEKLINNDFADAFSHSESEKIRQLAVAGELRIEDEEFFPGGHLTRYYLHSTTQKGVQEIAQLAPGFSVITTNFESIGKQATSYSGRGWVVLQCCVSGEYDIIVNDGKPQRLRPGDCRLDILMDDATWTRRQRSSTHFRYVSVFLRPDDLFLLLSAGERSRAALKNLLSPNNANTNRYYTFVASKNLIATVNEIAEFGDFGGLRPAFVKAKAIELLVFAFTRVRWLESQCDNLPQRAKLSRGARIAHQVREIIDREFAVPLTIDKLANRVGSNRTTLAKAFKTVYCMPPMQYLKRTRLENAREMLLHHEGTLQAVAEHVGYKDTASFIRAYREHFGITPGRQSP
jgi:AraC family transcriptional regulator, transcriptional activator of the genes for pyochelin and ferripyochelin receptors